MTDRDPEGPQRSKLDRWLIILKPWPLLAGAVTSIAAAILVLNTEGRAAELGTGLAVLGAVCVGAWIALLAAHGYRGHD